MCCVYGPNDENPIVSGKYVGLLTALCDLDEPSTMHEALHNDNSEKWNVAMIEEYNALITNETWELTDLPPERKAIDSKWIFKLKRNADGTVERFKARLVVKGYSQTKGID